MNEPKTVTPATNLIELQQQVGEWSRRNFGDQISKTEEYEATVYTPQSSISDPRKRKVKLPIYLGSLASLMGMMEEVGELGYARTDPDVQDAISDIMIYTCDYSYREGITFKDGIVFNVNLDPFFSPSEGIKHSATLAYNSLFTCSLFQQITGKLSCLYRTVLKRHQGIRGFEVDEKYSEAKEQYLWEFTQAIANFSQTFYGLPPLYFALKVWNKKISKRNWVADPSGQTHHPEEMKENESS